MMKLIKNNKDLALILGMVLILIVLFAPIPAVFLDLAILVNFGFGLTILLMTFYVSKPADFSTFPSLLLIATLFRLSLNIAATRLILSGGEAGEVIGSIGSFAVGGNYIVGLVVFFILIIVQYVVVTSGAQRVSEVAARFTLDSMPGQQMSIDADLNMGLIDQKTAVARREALEKEASFYGSMDGASKFVKGDSIAGVIILLIDIFAGWFVGVAQMGMNWNEALQHFTLLTIGDGIATQLPALIISIATGIIVTRSASDKDLSREILGQLISIPRVPVLVAAILCALMLLPGMPKWPIIVVLTTCGIIWFQIRNVKKDIVSGEDDENDVAASGENTLYPPKLSVDLGSALAAAWANENENILNRIELLRSKQKASLGHAFPPIKLISNENLGSHDYEIKLFGTRYANSSIEPDKQLAIRGQNTIARLPGNEMIEPAYGLPSVWIDSSNAPKAQEYGYTVVDPITIFITHLGEVLSSEAPTLLTRSETSRLLEGLREDQPGLVEELIPNQLTISDVQKILQNLLDEKVPIDNFELIVEHLVDVSRQEKDCNALTEIIRGRLGYIICNKLKGKNKDLAVLSLDPRVENLISQSQSTGSVNFGVPPRLAEPLIKELTEHCGKMTNAGRSPVLLCSGDIRFKLKTLVRRTIPSLSVISVAEIPMNIELQSFGIVKLASSELITPTESQNPKQSTK